MTQTQDDRPASIYEAMKAAGVPIDSHASDMYVPVNETSTAILKRFPEHRASVFSSKVDGRQWYDIPFAYLPWWQKRARKSGTTK